MTVEPAVSLTDQGYEFAKALVKKGRFASVSAVLQHGLHLVEREEEEHGARLEAIRIDFARRAEQPAVPTEEMDARLAAWREARDAGGAADLA